MVVIRRVHSADCDRIGELLGRAMANEPLMAWPMGGPVEDLPERCVRAYRQYLVPLVGAGLVWETEDGDGALVLVPPDESDVWDEAIAGVEESVPVEPDGDGRGRHERFWGWVAAKLPAEPCWHLDSVGVIARRQGQGLGSALVRFALAQAEESGTAVLLETSTARNVRLYERLGFRVAEAADSPDGGPHVWFMRRDWG